MNEYNEKVLRSKCKVCGFTFFTHYKSIADFELCTSCNPDDDKVKTVRNWEK